MNSIESRLKETLQPTFQLMKFGHLWLKILPKVAYFPIQVLLICRNKKLHVSVHGCFTKQDPLITCSNWSWQSFCIIKDSAYIILLLLRIHSVHLEILGFPMGGAHSYRGIFAQFKTMRKKWNLASALGIQKENWG